MIDRQIETQTNRQRLHATTHLLIRSIPLHGRDKDLHRSELDDVVLDLLDRVHLALLDSHLRWRVGVTKRDQGVSYCRRGFEHEVRVLQMIDDRLQQSGDASRLVHILLSLDAAAEVAEDCARVLERGDAHLLSRLVCVVVDDVDRVDDLLGSFARRDLVPHHAILAHRVAEQL